MTPSPSLPLLGWDRDSGCSPEGCGSRLERASEKWVGLGVGSTALPIPARLQCFPCLGFPTTASVAHPFLAQNAEGGEEKME